jgi:hypothetical protein
LDRLLREVAQPERRRIEHFLADAIAYASRTHPDRWGFTLEREWIRFNVGFVNNIVLSDRELLVLVERATAPRDLKLDEDEYRTAPGSGFPS